MDPVKNPDRPGAGTEPPALTGRDALLGEFRVTIGRVRYVTAEPSHERQKARSEAVAVLSLGDAAARLGISRRELEAMIDAGKVKTLPTGFTRTIPTGEIEQLTTKADL